MTKMTTPLPPSLMRLMLVVVALQRLLPRRRRLMYGLKSLARCGGAARWPSKGRTAELQTRWQCRENSVGVASGEVPRLFGDR